MSASVTLPGGERYRLRGGAGFPVPARPATSRVAFAAAHVVADPCGENASGAPATVDWDATLRFRHHLWRHILAQALRLADAAGLLPDADLAAARARAYFTTAGVNQ